MRHLMKRRPKLLAAGETAFFTPQSWIEKRSETAMLLTLIADRNHFGLIYSGLQPEYFDEMPEKSGVFAVPLVPIGLVSPGATFPGGIDVLIVPYENDELVLDRLLALEIKVVRASFAKQGKSPNDFGKSQVRGLLEVGAPYAALVHLIVSDQSPKWAWREMGIARIIDSNGTAEILPAERLDLLPMALIERAFGRLQQLRGDDPFGVAAAYIFDPNSWDEPPGRWFPETLPAEPNPNSSIGFAEGVTRLFERYTHAFIDIPRFDP